MTPKTITQEEVTLTVADLRRWQRALRAARTQLPATSEASRIVSETIGGMQAHINQVEAER